jgi:hypothetical protein
VAGLRLLHLPPVHPSLLMIGLTLALALPWCFVKEMKQAGC